MKAHRGRLSSIDLLPDEAAPCVSAALAALGERRRTQEDIRAELNGCLKRLGLGPVSRSAFNRKALSIAAVGQQLTQAREVAAIMAEKLNDLPEGDVGLLLIEALKTLIYDVVMAGAMSGGDGEDGGLAMLSKAADAVMRLERARKTNAETRRLAKHEFAAQVADAVEGAGREAGLSAEMVARIRREVLGVVEK
jgi:hypothetical protein